MKIILIILVLSLFTFKSYSQIIFDLSDSKNTIESIDIKNNQVVLFKNLAYKGLTQNQYSFIIELEEEPIPSFSSRGLETASEKGTSCNPTISRLIASYTNAEEEKDVPDRIKKLEKEIEKLDVDTNKDCIDYLRSLINSSLYAKPLSFELRNNQKITIIVKRKIGNDTIVWTKVFKTPTKSPWKIMYGFTFVPNLLNPVTNYYSNPDTSGKQFIITKLNNQRNDFFKNISPTLMLTWTPSVKYTLKKGEWCKALFSNNFYQVGFVGGVSLNFANETGAVNVMAGPSIVIADNISLSGGVVLTQKSILKGTYQEGQVLKENLDFDQLHEKKYMIECFFSLAIRFDSNPFKKEENK